MHIGVAYADRFKQVWLTFEIANGSTVAMAIEQSGILQQFDDIDLTRQRVGIFGKITKLDATVNEGDRVEIYRDITADPESVERRDEPRDADD
ncbi:MAG: RnfH family protein [Gammaproteobacteria bacterium]|nr:RnfH family protein [Gammaproteobacteria bacterium]